MPKNMDLQHDLNSGHVDAIEAVASIFVDTKKKFMVDTSHKR